MVKPLFPLFAVLVAVPCAAKELSEADFIGEVPVVLTASRLAQPIQDAPNAISVIDRVAASPDWWAPSEAITPASMRPHEG
ncbi:MAG: hypothetical protein Q8O33_03995 [Pseudomonadota bacterium]|nr:hypothetical protein [Pseudomonadota bacterium]